MTELEWLECKDLWPMLDYLNNEHQNLRKLRLFNCACCRRVWDTLRDSRSQEAVEVGERYADGLCSEEVLDRAWEAAYQVASEPRDGPACAAACTALPNILWSRIPEITSEAAGPLGSPAWNAAFQGLTPIVRCIFGNPFRFLALETAWQTPVVLSLAQAAYDDRILPAGTLDLDRLAVLADALEDAGCDSADLLSHLRGPGPHVRGCWALDLILGKQ